MTVSGRPVSLQFCLLETPEMRFLFHLLSHFLPIFTEVCVCVGRHLLLFLPIVSFDWITRWFWKAISFVRPLGKDS